MSASVVPRPTSAEFEAEKGSGDLLSATYLVNTLNSHLAAAGGGSVEIKRCNRETGEIIDEPEDAQGSGNAKKEMLSQVDFQMRAGQLARLLQVLSPEEKLEWAVARKEEGNRLFTAENTDAAIQRYLDATVGLDFGDSPAQADRARKLVQIPVLTNLAACCMRKKEWTKAVRFCDQALQADSDHVKALLRRARARTELGDLRGAKADLACANKLSPGCGKTETRLLREAIAAASAARQDHRELAQRMLRPQASSAAEEAATNIRPRGNCCEILAAKAKRFLSFRTDPPVKFE